MKKIIDKIFNITIVLILISGLLSYQFVLPARVSHAEDEIAPAVTQEEATAEASAEEPAEEPAEESAEPADEPEETAEIQQTSDLENCLDCSDADSASVNTASGTENTVAAEANTGENAISGSAENADVAENLPEENIIPAAETENNPEAVLPEAAIETGDAGAEAGGVNVVNTNITTENGQQEIINLTGETTGDVNLLETFETLLENGENSSGDGDGDEEENKKVVNINTATDVENSAEASANTGTNSIENISGNADITTGEAFAAASIINLINTNIVGDNWLLAIINILGNWTGDLIVPGEGLLFTTDSGMQFGDVVNVNEAVDVENNVSAEAGTGGNSISGAGSASISTGEAQANASAVNLINTNLVKNNWFFLIINNAGNWVGRVMGWGADGSQQSIYEYNFGSLSGLSGATGPAYDVYNYNSAANVSNTATATASTGNNSIQNSGSASISTGNATAWASAFNFVNTNIVGNNWLFGVVNNAGTWNGNVVFAYPDLAVTLSADREHAMPGEAITYTVNYKNVGKAKCGNVDLQFSLPQYLQYQSGDSGLSGSGGNNYSLSAAGLNPGEERSFNVTANVAENIPTGSEALEAVIGARTNTKEVELSNNYSSEEVSVYFAPVVIKDESALSKKESGLEIDRKDDEPAYVNGPSNHYIKVENSGKHTLYNIVVTEKIKNSSGDTVAEYNWPISKLKKGQTAYIQYQIILDNTAILGTYTYSASSEGYDQYGNKIKSEKAKAEIELLAGGAGISGAENNGEIIPPVAVEENQQPEVLGAATTSVNANYFSLWLLMLLLIPAYYYIREKKLYRRENLLRLSKRMAGFLSSFL
ncbi:MAG: hypothetical protein WCX17_03490 [Parcubacteria group bacterium]|jgi:uncharacterized repeat protein (TIGR01451 family)